MESITLGQISTFLGFLVVLVGSILTLIKYAKKGLKSALNDEFEPIKKELSNLDTKITLNTLNQDKNFLTKCFDDLESGVSVSETTKERIFECMKDYKKNGGNSYIEHRFNSLKKNNII